MTTSGLWTRNYAKDYPSDRYAQLLNGNVCLLTWAKIEPQPGVFDIPYLMQVAEAAQHGQVGLRILGGANAPTWMKHKVPSFTYVEGVSRDEYTIPQWWNGEYMHRWEYMLYVVHSFIGKFVDVIYQTGGATVYGEPMIRAPWQNTQVYNEMGFNKEVDTLALSAFYNSMSAAWYDTDVAVSCFPYQGMVDERPHVSLQQSIDFVEVWQPNLAGFNDLREDPGKERLAAWEAVWKLDIAMFFQTANPKKIGDWEIALAHASEYGAKYVELNRDFTDYDYEKLGDHAYSLSQT